MPDKGSFRDVGSRLKDKPDLHDAVMLLCNMFDLMCPALFEHSQELAENCEALARHLGQDREKQLMAFLGGLLHDVGHLMSPGQICNWLGEGPPPLRNMEVEHPDCGVRLLKNVACLAPLIPVVKHHHEHYNGSGFPDGLGGTDIPELARLVAVAHHYQTLIRGYKPTLPLTAGEAMRVLEEDAGVLVDPEMAKVFLAKVAC